MPKPTRQRPGRAIIKIAVDSDAHQIIRDYSTNTGLKQEILAGRIYRWFALQPDVFKKSILGLLPEGMEADVAKLALERLASDNSKSK